MKTLIISALACLLGFSLSAANRTSPGDTEIGVDELLELATFQQVELEKLDDGHRPNPRSLEAKLDTIRREIDKLRSSKKPDELRAKILDRIHDLSLGITAGRVARQDEIGVRVEENLGIPLRHPDDVTPDDSPWLSTQARQFVNIRKTAFLGKASGRDLDIVNGIQMTGSFVAEQDSTQVGILFSAETYVDTADKRLFVRALVDGSPVAPSDVVFATGTHQGVRAFLFTTTVNAGIHTVEMQWQVDPGATAFMRTASLLIRSGRSLATALGSLSVVTPPSGAGSQHNQPAWLNVPGASGWIYVPNQGVLTATFSAECFVSDGKALAVRALVDNAPAAPGDVVFARGGSPQSRCVTFGSLGLPAGWHFVRMQWLAEAGGTATLGDRSLMLAAYASPANHPTHAFVAAPSGPNIQTIPGFQLVPNLVTQVEIPAKGNGEVAVHFSGEIVATKPVYVLLAVDNSPLSDTIIELTDGNVAGQIKSFVLTAKQLPAGLHRIEIWWAAQSGSVAQMGDRSIAVMSEVGFIPDLAEQRILGSGTREKGDNVHGLEPLIGTRNVLLVLWDPLRPGHPLGVNTPPGPDFVLPGGFTGVITKAQVQHAFFGPTDSANQYYHAVSGGKFAIHNAGVVGWLAAQKEPNHYFDTHPECDTSTDGYASENQERWSEALKSADPSFNFKQFDRDGDGVLRPAELAIVIVVPQSTIFGTARQEVYAQECPSRTPLILDDVRLTDVLEVFINFNNELDAINVAAHELLHQLGGADDMYNPVAPAVRAGRMSIMAATSCMPHLDPAHKLAFGSVTPRRADSTGLYSVEDAKLSHSVFVLPRYNDGPFGEYFLFENRQDSDELGPLYDTFIDSSGIAVWHVIENTTESAKIPRGVSQAIWDGTTPTQARRAIRLLRPWEFIDANGALLAGIDPLWSSANYDLQSAPCPILFIPPGGLAASENTLTWADCSPGGYNLQFLSPPGPNMTVRVEVE